MPMWVYQKISDIIIVCFISSLLLYGWKNGLYGLSFLLQRKMYILSFFSNKFACVLDLFFVIFHYFVSFLYSFDNYNIYLFFSCNLNPKVVILSQTIVTGVAVLLSSLPLERRDPGKQFEIIRNILTNLSQGHRNWTMASISKG